MHNEIHELSIDELNTVAGGGPIEWLVGWAAGKIAEAIVTAKDSTPTNVMNAVLVTIGQKPA